MGYAGMMGCVLDFLEHINQAVEQIDEDDEEHGEEGDCCAICHDTVGARSDRGRSSLSVVVLPQCGHRFHELCLLNWISPITLPPTSLEESVPSSPSSESSLGGIGTTLQAIAAAYGYHHGEDTDTLTRLIPRADTSDDDLEEGEVREDELTNQALPYFNLFNGQFRPVAIYQTTGPGALSHTCPLCRLPAFYRDTPYCHGDNLIFLRVRIRLADLAQECCGTPRNTDDLEAFNNVADFLERRFNDNLALGEREAPIDPTETRGYFLVARLLLVEEAVSHLQNLTRRTEHRTNGLLLLISFLKNFVLRDRYSNYFFDPTPRSLDEWDLKILDDNPMLLYEDPEAFCLELRLKDEGADGSSSSDGGPPLVPERLLLEARRAERENNTRMRMAISTLLDDSHDDDAEMEEASPTSPVSHTSDVADMEGVSPTSPERNTTDVAEMEDASPTDGAAPQWGSPFIIP
ncbi:hypothetical protein Q9189_003560 [Teloschistes chrysophthalmus]